MLYKPVRNVGSVAHDVARGWMPYSVHISRTQTCAQREITKRTAPGERKNNIGKEKRCSGIHLSDGSGAAGEAFKRKQIQWKTNVWFITITVGLVETLLYKITAGYAECVCARLLFFAPSLQINFHMQWIHFRCWMVYVLKCYLYLLAFANEIVSLIFGVHALLCWSLFSCWTKDDCVCFSTFAFFFFGLRQQYLVNTIYHFFRTIFKFFVCARRSKVVLWDTDIARKRNTALIEAKMLYDLLCLNVTKTKKI